MMGADLIIIRFVRAECSTINRNAIPLLDAIQYALKNLTMNPLQMR